MKESLQQALSLISEPAQLGLITYGKNVHIYELGFDEGPKSYVLNGSKEYQPQVLADLLGLSSPAPPLTAAGAAAAGVSAGAAPSIFKRFFQPIAGCELIVSSILEDLDRGRSPSCPLFVFCFLFLFLFLFCLFSLLILLFLPPSLHFIVALSVCLVCLLSSFCLFSPPCLLHNLLLQIDCWPSQPNHRKLNCCGSAMSVAISLLEIVAVQTNRAQNARILLLCGSAPTAGPGLVVGLKNEQTMRSHADLQKGVPMSTQALEFYTMLSRRAAASAIVVDIFACCLDQVCEIL